METESRMVVADGWLEGGCGASGLQGEFQFGKEKF